MLPEVQALIAHYDLKHLPVEGMLFTQSYRSDVAPETGLALSIAIIALYCEDPRSVSLFHRLTVDEVWHFYGGDPLRLILLYPDGSSRDVTMGNDPLNGHEVQFVVPAGVWQAGHVREGGKYSLFGCTVAPGFSAEMFEGGTRDGLMESHPGRAEDIIRLCCAPGQIRMDRQEESVRGLR